MMEPFEQLIADLGKVVGEPLKPDQNQACLLKIDERIDVQLEYDPEAEQIMIAAFITEVSPGKYREDLLQSALYENGNNQAFGALGYINELNTLTLHKYLPILSLTGETLAAFLNSFLEKALSWKEIVNSGSIKPPASQNVEGSSIFDIKKDK